jgi:hypothetical protein
VSDYDSTADTLRHSLRVGELMGQPTKELVERSTQHDHSKTADPEKETFDRVTPQLKNLTYGSDEYKAALADMGPALAHHYANNRHHPEFVDREIEWRPVVGYEGHYEVSSLGDIRSADRMVSRGGPTGDVFKPGQVRKAHLTPKGYCRLALVLNGQQRNHLVHRLVAEAFLANPDNKPEVNHRNGNKADNRVVNLEWATESENQIHAYETGLREANVKYVVHCPELDITTFGTLAMEREVRKRGYDRVTSAGIWAAMDRGGKHWDLTFEGAALAEYRRSQFSGMTLVDLIEMLADWKAATERTADGDLARSLEIQRDRFGIDPQVVDILRNTAWWFGWLICGAQGVAPNGERLDCNQQSNHRGHPHCDGSRDNLLWRDGEVAYV